MTSSRFGKASSAIAAVGSAGELEQTYDLSGQLRVGSLTSKSENNTVSRSFAYAYETGTDWFKSVSSGSGGFAHSRTYDPNQPFLNSVAATWNGGAAITAYDYTYDARGLRATARQSGSAFADYGTGLAGSPRRRQTARGTRVRASSSLPCLTSTCARLRAASDISGFSVSASRSGASASS